MGLEMCLKGDKKMKKIKSYRLELDAEKHPVLVTEKEATYGTLKFKKPEQVAEICNDLVRLSFLAEEHIVMVALDNKNNIIGVFTVGHGSVRECSLSPREILIRALVVGASSIIIVHNHPSGECEPSESDYECIRKFQEVESLIGIKFLDFIILGDCFYFSAKECDILD